MSSLSERRALRLAERRIRGLDAVLALLEQTPAMAAQAFDGVIRSRGVVLNELVRRQQVLPRSASPALQALWGRSQNTRARFVNLQLRDPGDDGATYRAELESSRAAMEDAERKLAESSELGTNRLLEDLRGFELVRGSLPSGSSLVAYTQYEDEGRSYLGAFTLLAGESQPHWQSLGTVDVIEDELRLWREQAAYGEGAPRGIVSRSRDKSVRFESYVKVAQELRERIWDPLPESIRESAQVYLVADGPLHSLSFDGLVDSEGRFLVESDTRFQWIASERSLFPTHNTANSGVLAVGDPTLPRPRGSESGRCSHELLSSLAQLSAARDEARTVARIWEAQEAVTLLVGDDATEPHLIAAAPGVRLLHLATHGFVLDSDCFSTEFGLAANHPLVRTGILVSPTSGGSSEAQEDGWWTAQEIAALDLRGVECVVLSACGTALGERRSDGEGVHGLRRALEIAGAEATIVSLWAVDDRATEDWMSRLHRISAERKTPLLRAAREAHRETIASRRTAGLSVHPFYWAGFVSVAATDALR
jgi:CHAT domain-containing protein